ncbi:MAG: T9SS type A sorting domain-containing protein [Flavipsychrobacter sp.]|nr:T9SS type A sorting domain-containing protein [Flavipsychrobacter sp.]
MIRNHLIKLLYFSSFLAIGQPPSLAQGLYVTPSTQVVVSGNAFLVLSNCDLHQDGTFAPGTGTVKFSGSSAATGIYGSNVGLYNMTLDEATSDVVLNTDVSVSNNLNMLSHHVELNNFNLDLGTTGTIVGEGNASYITGLTGGWVLRTETLNAPTNANPGNIGIELTTPGNLGTTLIRRGHVQQTGTLSGIGIARYFDFLPSSGNASLNAALNFHYLDHELIGITESELAMSARDVPMGYWNLLGVDNLDMANNVLTKNGIDTLGRFTLTSSQNNTLPIRLLSFHGSLVNAQVLLQWEVANDLSVLRYDVEESEDGTTFTRLGSLESKKGSFQVAYDMLDTKPQRGANYYRLKMYDNMNHPSYSKTIRVNLDGVTTLSVYPNPVTDKVVVDFVCTEIKPLSFQLLDVQGKLIATKEVQPQAGSNRVTWDIATLPAATYYIRLNGLSESPIKISKL